MSKSLGNVWGERFDSLDDQQIRTMSAMPARPVSALRSMSTELACSAITNAWQRTFTPTAQTTQLLRSLYSIATATARELYPTRQSFFDGAYRRERSIKTDRPATCLTGLAGTGKTSIIEALGRVLPPATPIGLGDGHPRAILQSHWSFKLHKRTRISAIHAALLDQARDVEASLFGDRSDAIESRDTSRGNHLAPYCAKLAWLQGVPMIVGDELQHLSQSERANASVTSVLLQLNSIGPALVYCCNFSLVHRLLRRAQEDKQRLLSDVLIVHPEVDGSEDWCAVVGGYCAPDPSIFPLSSKESLQRLHFYTFGLNRLVKSLLLEAYRFARKRGGNTAVDMDDLEKAYRSNNYFANRCDVEVLHRMRVESVRNRDDLRSPWQESVPLGKGNKDGMSPAAANQFAKQVVRSSLTVREAETLAQLRSAAKGKLNAEVVSIKKGKLNAEDLLRNLQSVRDEKNVT